MCMKSWKKSKRLILNSFGDDETGLVVCETTLVR